MIAGGDERRTQGERQPPVALDEASEVWGGRTRIDQRVDLLAVLSKITEHIRERVRGGELAPAVAALKKDADAALTVAPLSVIDNPVLPPSGDKHDYMSQAPYFWPDPAARPRLPHIRAHGLPDPGIRQVTGRTGPRMPLDAGHALFARDQRDVAPVREHLDAGGRAEAQVVRGRNRDPFTAHDAARNEREREREKQVSHGRHLSP
jgi:hypothetical protein